MLRLFNTEYHQHNKEKHHPYTNIYKKKLNKSDVTAEIIESRLSFLSKKNRIENKLANGKGSYFIKDQTFLNGSMQPNVSDKSSPIKL